MLKVDDKVVNLVEKLRRAVKDEKIQADIFPMEEIGNLIEYTLGESFWECIGSRSNYGFGNLPEIYKECLEDAVKRKDMKECDRILHLFECTYQVFYTALDQEEKVFRQKPYRKMIIDLGTANSQMQYREHNKRQAMFKADGKGKLGEGKGVVYTCLIGEKVLNQPEEVSMQIDYLCFTDDEEKWGKKEGVWTYCQAESIEKIAGIEEMGDIEETEKVLLESKYKIMAHELLKAYDYSIWVAPDITIVGDVLRFSKIYGKNRSLLAFPNAKEDCIYEDMSVTQMATDDLNVKLRKTMIRYQKEGYPDHNGLIDGRIIIRDHRDKELGRVMDMWWQEVKNGYLLMDNMFNYVAWKCEFPFSICNLFIYENSYFKVNGIDLDTHEDL